MGKTLKLHGHAARTLHREPYSSQRPAAEAAQPCSSQHFAHQHYAQGVLCLAKPLYLVQGVAAAAALRGLRVWKSSISCCWWGNAALQGQGAPLLLQP
jgi:hypothetical protein